MSAAALLFLLLTSCLKDHNTYYNPPTALLSFIQASPDEPQLDFFLNNNKVNQAFINYGDTFDYFSAYAGHRTASFYTAGTMTKIFSDTITLNQNMAYSLFLANKPSSPEILLLTDSISRPSSGNASIRFVNVSPDAPPVSLAIQGGQVLASNEPYKGSTSFMPIAGGKNYAFEVRQGTTNTVLATLTNVNLSSGFVYTIWFHGLVASTNNSDKLSIGIITNAYYN
jgi:hypothetical protein